MNLVADKFLLVLSPVRDEEDTLTCTIASVLAQSRRPDAWLLIDDGSTDGTRRVMEQAAAEHDFITVAAMLDRGHRQPGPGVVEAFELGLRLAEGQAWDFVGKLDGDVELPCDYYQRILEAFEDDGRLGIASGVCVTPHRGGYRTEANAPFHTRGPCKVYRRACFEAIGGLAPMLGWDGADGYAARSKGWSTKSLSELKVIHFRPTHAADGRLGGAMRAGLGAWNLHYRPDYLLARALLASLRQPYGLGGLGLLVGYAQGLLSGAEGLKDPELLAYIRRQQARRLWGRFGLGSGED